MNIEDFPPEKNSADYSSLDVFPLGEGGGGWMGWRMGFSDFPELSNRRSIKEIEGIVGGVRDNFAEEKQRFTLLGVL